MEALSALPKFCGSWHLQKAAAAIPSGADVRLCLVSLPSKSNSSKFISRQLLKEKPVKAVGSHLLCSSIEVAYVQHCSGRIFTFHNISMESYSIYLNPHKQIKEDFVSKLNGTSILEIATLATIMPVLILLRQWNVLQLKWDQGGSTNIQMEEHSSRKSSTLSVSYWKKKPLIKSICNDAGDMLVNPGCGLQNISQAIC